MNFVDELEVHFDVSEGTAVAIVAYLTELRELKRELVEAEVSLQKLADLRVCHGKMSGRHCIHGTGVNCPYPGHELGEKKRVRKSVANGERERVEQAIANRALVWAAERVLEDARRQHTNFEHRVHRLGSRW